MKRQFVFFGGEPYGLREVAKTAENKVKGVAFDLWPCDFRDISQGEVVLFFGRGYKKM